MICDRIGKKEKGVEKMLELILGRAGTGKTEYLRSMLNSEKDCKAILLVPEQYSFETERAILEKYGVKAANSTKVYSFTRLADAAFLKYGGGAGKRLSDGGRRILMTLAIEACVDNLTIFEKSAATGHMTDAMLNAVGEMKLCGITPDALSETADRISEKGLSQKVRELAIIFGTYNALVEQSWLDPMDDLTKLDALLAEHPDFFEDTVIAVDAFDGFTEQEYRILKHMMQHSRKLSIALCCDDLNTEKQDIFSSVRKTASKLIRIARENNIKVAAPKSFDKQFRFTNKQLVAVESAMLENSFTADDGDIVEVFKAASPYEEAEIIAAKIRELVISGDYRYRDISVICRNPDRYTRLLSAAFRRWDIPAFMSEARAIDSEPLMRFVVSAFDIVNSGWQSDDILNMLKTGLTALTIEEISLLENYIFTWKLNGKRAWQSPFEKHPEGYGKPMDEAAAGTLEALNSIRLRVIEPLRRFSDSITDANSETISEAIYTLLSDYELETTLPQLCASLEHAGHPELKDAQLRIWELLMSVLDQMVGVLGTQPISSEKYARLLREIMRGEDVYDIPQSMDSITFGTADRIRSSEPKVVFLVGVVQGEFPMIPTANGIFSDIERRELLSLELPLTDTAEDCMIQEQFLAYSAMCAASERLYLSFPATDGKDAKTPSELVTAVMSVFPGKKIIEKHDPIFFANAPEAAFSQLASMYTSNSVETASLKAALGDIPEFSGRISALGGGERMAHAKLERDVSEQIFRGNKYFSASQIEVYHQCRFRYFCRYGLGAKERRAAELDALEYGTLMHYLFEEIIGSKSTPIEKMATDTLLARIEACIREYVDENMGGFDSLSAKEQYRFTRMAQTAEKLILHVAAELKVCRFKPEHFELQLQYGSEFPPLRIPTENGSVTVGGVIDRVDVYHSEHGDYVRIIDYKTGIKDFKLYDVLYGLSLQMLIYLTALTENTQLKPAGILYMPSFLTTVNSDKTESTEKLLESAEKKLRMNGLVLNDIEIANAMEDGINGKYIPVTMKKNGELKKSASLIDEPALRIVMSYVKSLIATMAQTLANGDVAAQPLMYNTNSCSWCPYTSVCGSERMADPAESFRMDNDEIISKLKGEIGGV